MQEGSSCTVKVETSTLTQGQCVTFIRVKHFNGGSDIVVKAHGCRKFDRIPLMPGKTVEDYLTNSF